MLDRILVPLDGSEISEAILPQVRRLLAGRDAEVMLLRVVPPPPAMETGTPAVTIEESIDSGRRYIERKQQELVDTGVKARGLTFTGEPAETILDLALRERADLVAISTHGRTGLARWVYGSIAEKVMRASPVPLLLVRSFRGAAPAAPAELPISRILVPVDGSDLSLEILPFVCEFARLFDAHVTLLHVMEPAGMRLPSEATARLLARATATLKATGIPSATELRKTDEFHRSDPAVEILEFARDRGTDLIAMSTHGRSGVSRWALGSVTEKVLRAAPVPMLVVRGRGKTETAASLGRM